MKGMVVVHFDEQGEPTFHVCGDHVRLMIIDERAPGDRVYEWLPRDDDDHMKQILGDGPIGSSADDRHAAIANVIRRTMAGKKHL